MKHKDEPCGYCGAKNEGKYGMCWTPAGWWHVHQSDCVEVLNTRLTAANAEIERLRQAVSSAANVFRSYVAIHHLKHTPEGDEKAKSNATMAALMELALAGQDSK